MMLIQRAITGGIAGFLATGPMTLIMLAMHRILPTEQRYPLPPWEITSRVESEAGAGRKVSHTQHQALTLAMHFGYGAASGSSYALTARHLSLRPPISGALFALLIWAGSYLGWLPVLNILRPATQHPAERNILMITSHLVWGTTLGAFIRLLEQREI